MSDRTDIWYPFFVGDYRRDTARLSCVQHGAYRQLIDEYWVAGPLPDDDEILARIVGLDVAAWVKERSAVERFFKIRGGKWRHKRIDKELILAAERKAKNGARARAAAEARWEKERAQSNAPSMLEASDKQCLGDALHNSSLTFTGSALTSQGELDSDSQDKAQGLAEVIPLDGRAGR